jgi:single-strand DNA-binding protein
MSFSLNRVTLLGRLGKDPELNYTTSGKSVAKFSLATEYSYKDRNGEWQKQTAWHQVIVWGKTGEFAAKHLAKGHRVCVEGRIDYRQYEDKGGNKRNVTEIIAETVIPLGESDGNARSAAGARQSSEEYVSPEITDDDIPF